MYNASNSPWLIPPPPISGRRVIIIGAGLAGAHSAYVLSKRGFEVTLLEKASLPAQGASGNHAGAITPVVSSDNNPLSQFITSGFYTALKNYQQLNNIQWDQCGVLRLARNDRHLSQLKKIAAHIDSALGRFMTSPEATEIAGIPLSTGGILFPRGGWANPPSIVKTLLHKINITPYYQHEAILLTKTASQQWQVTCKNNTRFNADCVVLCNADDAKSLVPEAKLPITPIRGQVSYLSVTGFESLKVVISKLGYLTPAHQNIVCAGASFEKSFSHLNLRQEEHDFNQKLLTNINPELLFNPIGGRVSLRSTSPDRLPLVGAITNDALTRQYYADLHYGRHYQTFPSPPYLAGLYINVAHGARGLTTTPLSAEILADIIMGRVTNHRTQFEHMLSPIRFALRDCRRSH